MGHTSDEAEIQEYENAVDWFACAMKAKLRRKIKEGVRGGLDPSSRDYVAGSLIHHVKKHPLHEGQEADIANLAMMLWYTRMDLILNPSTPTTPKERDTP